MARTAQEIKAVMTGIFVENAVIRDLYELDANKNFDEQFSKASLESILFYDFAAGIQTLEKIFDTHKMEVNELIENTLPHRAKWYRDKALNFMLNKLLIPDTDKYDTDGMSDEEISAAKVVKYATAIEEQGSSVLVIKIATGEAGALEPLPGGSGDEATGQAGQFLAYMKEIRDAGVRISMVNLPGDNFFCELDIYYSALLLESDVMGKVQDAIKAYLTGLPFNGEYSNMALVDAVQQVDGVRIAEFKSAQSSVGNYINAKMVPAAGYFTYTEENITLNLTPHNVAL